MKALASMARFAALKISADQAGACAHFMNDMLLPMFHRVLVPYRAAFADACIVTAASVHQEVHSPSMTREAFLKRCEACWDAQMANGPNGGVS
jgi:hypothetical protein